MKIELLQNQNIKCQRCNESSSNSFVEFFMVLQEKMERLVNWLVDKTYLKNGKSLAEFSAESSAHLYKRNSS